MNKPPRTYLSSRGLPLVYADVPMDRPVLTVENHPKWYGFCLVCPDGSVEDVHFGALEQIAGPLGTFPYVDHVPNARLVPDLAEARGWILDAVSYELMVGRWVSEVESPREYDF